MHGKDNKKNRMRWKREIREVRRKKRMKKMVGEGRGLHKIAGKTWLLIKIRRLYVENFAVIEIM